MPARQKENAMPLRPEPQHRRNIRGVIYPLTAAIRHVYGIRSSDGSYPLGAFYTVHIDSTTWQHAGGIWSSPIVPEEIENRNVNTETMGHFMDSIATGQHVQLPSGTIVTWERIPDTLVQQLPSV